MKHANKALIACIGALGGTLMAWIAQAAILEQSQVAPWISMAPLALAATAGAMFWSMAYHMMQAAQAKKSRSLRAERTVSFRYSGSEVHCHECGKLTERVLDQLKCLNCGSTANLS